MSATSPVVSIGMPVYNAQNFLAQTLEAILAQTYTDFELLISDNASSDQTETICRRYAARDPRIRYIRHPSNLGASENFNRLVAMSNGRYFKWAAHDDLCAPEFLAKCVQMLDSEPSAVLCYTRGQVIDQDGNTVQVYQPKPGLAATHPQRRYHEAINAIHPGVGIVPMVIFGLIRIDELAKTSLIGNYASSDGVLLGDLSLRGRCVEVPDYLFSYRAHADQSRLAYSRYELEGWYDPARSGKITFPHWRLLAEHFAVVRHSTLNWREKAWCYLCLVQWSGQKWRGLIKDVTIRNRNARAIFGALVKRKKAA